MLKVFFLFLVLLNISAFSLPQMVRHGYTSCRTCHVSTTGAGLLTPYGRSLSKEVLSTWSGEGEEAFAYGAIKPPKWLSLGVQLRAAQIYQDTPTIRRARFIPMQADVEAGVTFGKFDLVGVVGLKRPENQNPSFLERLTSRRHYLRYRLKENISLRFGRFYPAFGIRFANHTLVTRKDLGWDQGMESHNLEFAYYGEEQNLFLTTSLGRLDESLPNEEVSVMGRYSRMIAESHQIGVSLLYGSRSGVERQVFGLFGLISIHKTLFLIWEMDLQRNSNSLGFVNYAKLNYEPYQGVNFYLSQQLSKLDLGADRTIFNGYGVGIQLFPRPHFEVNAEWQWQRRVAVSNAYSDFAWLIFHFYL